MRSLRPRGGGNWPRVVDIHRRGDGGIAAHSAARYNFSIKDVICRNAGDRSFPPREAHGDDDFDGASGAPLAAHAWRGGRFAQSLFTKDLGPDRRKSHQRSRRWTARRCFCIRLRRGSPGRRELHRHRSIGSWSIRRFRSPSRPMAIPSSSGGRSRDNSQTRRRRGCPRAATAVWTSRAASCVGAGAVGTRSFKVPRSPFLPTAILPSWADLRQLGVGAAWVFTRSNGVWTQQGQQAPGHRRDGASRTRPFRRAFRRRQHRDHRRAQRQLYVGAAGSSRRATASGASKATSSPGPAGRSIRRLFRGPFCRWQYRDRGRTQ